jgi:hypothetical protein
MFSEGPEFALYDYNKFSSRLATIIAIIKQFEERAAEDRAALELYISNHTVSHYDWKGYIQSSFHWCMPLLPDVPDVWRDRLIGGMQKKR